MRLIGTALLLSWIPVSLLHGQTGRTQGNVSATDAPKHVVSGTVVNSVTGTPISRALVELSSDFSRYTMTDGNGDFRFDGVAEGFVKLEAERPGFFKPTDENSGRVVSSDFQVERDMNGIVLKLVPSAVVTVHVHSVTGVPIQDYPIRLYERLIVDGAVQWGNETSVVSDVDGYCGLYTIHAGSYVISGGPERWRPRPPGAKHVGYPLVFYPNVHELSAASVLTITVGQKVEVDFSLSRESLFEVSGNVVDVPEAVDTKIELSSSEGDPVPLEQPHPARHDFIGYATAGRYTLRARAEVNAKPMTATLPLTVGANTAGIHVVLRPQVSIPVNVTSDFADTNRDRGSDNSGVSVKLRSTTGFSPIQLLATLEHGNRNAMEVSGVEPGGYSVEINPFRGYVRTATSGSTDLLQNDLVAPEDGNVEPIEIVLGNDGGEVSGSVKLPDPNVSATVLLVPERRPIKLVKSALTQPGGAFTFEQIAPGDYLLFAFDRIKDLEYKNADVLSSYRSSAAHVYVSSHQHVTTTLDVIRLEK